MNPFEQDSKAHETFLRCILPLEALHSAFRTAASSTIVTPPRVMTSAENKASEEKAVTTRSGVFSPFPTVNINYLDTIIVVVDSSETKFTIHDDVITRSSEFFRAAVGGVFKEAREKVVTLPQMEVEVFKSYVQWAYTGKVVVVADDLSFGNKDGQNHFKALAKLYIAGDVLGNRRLRNAAMDRFTAVAGSTKHVPWPETITIIYEGTHEHSPLRLFCLGCYLAIGRNVSPFETEPNKERQIFAEDSSWLRKNHDQFPTEFLMNLVEFMLPKYSIKSSADSKSGKCWWHEHGPDCPSCADVGKSSKPSNTKQ